LSYYPLDTLVEREAKGLQSAGFDVDVFCLCAQQSSEEEIDGIKIQRRLQQPLEEVIDGIQVHRFPIQRKKQGAGRNLFEYLVFFFLIAWNLAISHLRRQFSVIQVNTMPDFLVFATLIPRLLGAKITLQMYEPMPELWATKFNSQLPTIVLRKIQQWSIRYAHTVFTVTQNLKDNLVAHGANPNKIAVVLNAPDMHLFGVMSPHEPILDGDFFTLICHGAIEERYGHDTILHAIASLKASVPKLRLRVTGDGGYREEFLALRELLGLQDQVQYLGFVPRDQLVEELCRADVGIVAQKSSTYSNLVHTGKMYDYLALGKPVIASRLRAVQAYFDEASLCFFEPGDPDDLAQAIRGLYLDPQKRRTLVENSQKLYDQYKWEKQKEIYWSAYRKLLD
jgi:glycosyltransferase involved in cell wall biosynthesis